MQKRTTGVRLHPSLFDEMEKIIEDWNNTYPYGRKTRSSLIEDAIIIYINQYWKDKRNNNLK